MKILIILFVIIFTCFYVEASEVQLVAERNRIQEDAVKTKMDEPSLSLEKLPFSEIVDWRYRKNRQNYKKILKKAGYTIEIHEIHCMDKASKKIKNIWYEREFLEIVKKENVVVGSIWTTEKSTLPSLIYKLEDREFYEPQFIYSRIDKYEVIQSKNKRISLSYFELVSFNWFQKSFGKHEYKASVKKKILKSNYLRANSLKELLNYAEGHYQRILKILNSGKLTKNSPVELFGITLEKYKEIQKMIKSDIIKYGGKNWKKKWKDIQEKWPSMRKIK